MDPMNCASTTFESGAVATELPSRAERSSSASPYTSSFSPSMLRSMKRGRSATRVPLAMSHNVALRSSDTVVSRVAFNRWILWKPCGIGICVSRRLS